MSVASIDFKEKDEIDVEGFDSIEIEVVSNGWLVTLESDEEVFKYVYDFKNKGDLIAFLKESL